MDMNVDIYANLKIIYSDFQTWLNMPESIIIVLGMSEEKQALRLFVLTSVVV